MNNEGNMNGNTNVVNKGTGSGGANTNANGLPYEEQLSLETEYVVQETNTNHKVITFNHSDRRFITGKKTKFHENMRQLSNQLNDLQLLHGTKQPDQWFIDTERRKVYIIETKSQKGSGSTDEKLQTAFIKRRRLQKTYPDYDIHYTYALREWFRDNCPAEVDELIEDNIPIFWGDSVNFKGDIINYMISE